jgi:hypothetical protein
VRAALVTPFVGHLPLHPGSYLGYGSAVLGSCFDLDVIDFNALAFKNNPSIVKRALTAIERTEVALDQIHLAPLWGILAEESRKEIESIDWQVYAKVYITVPSWFVTVPTESILDLTRSIRGRSINSEVLFYGNSLGSWTDGAALVKAGIQLRHLNDLFQKVPAKRPVDFDTLPLPVYSDGDAYLFSILPFRLKHGCSWGRCRFCSLAKGWNGGYRERSVDGVIREIRQLMHTYHPRMLICRDNGINGGNLTAVLRALKDLDLTWIAMARVGLSAQQIKALHRAGCRSIYFGLESGSNEVLRRMEKGVTNSQISQFIKALHDNDIIPAPSLSVGYPDESERDYEESLRFLEDHAAYFKLVNIYPYTVTPASKEAGNSRGPHPKTLARLSGIIEHCRMTGLKVCVGTQTEEYELVRSVYGEIEF